MGHEAGLFFPSGGPMGALMWALDWSATPLGVPSSWPTELRTLVGVMSGAKQAMFVTWGAQRTMIYNEDYSEILGRKYPAAMGRPFFDVWPEVRDDIVPLMDQVYAGRPVHMDDITLYIERHGFLEEAHFAFSYTPVQDGQTGRILGLFCPCTETTAQVLVEQRLRESEARASGVFEGMDEGFILLDRAFIIQRINPAGLRLDGRSRERIVGRHLLQVWADAERLPTWPLYQQVMASQVAAELV